MSGLRAITIQMNLYDVQTGLFNAINVVFERSSARFFRGTKIEIMPFYLPRSDEYLMTGALIAMKILGVVWLVILVFLSLIKRQTLRSWTTLSDLGVTCILIGIQIAVIVKSF